jgi:Spy/CpxP family protein refolding chaperone
MKKYIFMSLLILPLILSSNAFARMGDGPGDGPPRHRGIQPGDKCDPMFFGNPDALKEKLDLTNDQVDKIAVINLEYKKKLLKIREKMQPKETRLQGLLLEDDVNLKEVRALLEEISVFHVEMGMLRITQRLDIEKVLTPAQRTELKNSRGGMMRMPHRFN